MIIILRVDSDQRELFFVQIVFRNILKTTRNKHLSITAEMPRYAGRLANAMLKAYIKDVNLLKIIFYATQTFIIELCERLLPYVIL